MNEMNFSEIAEEMHANAAEFEAWLEMVNGAVPDPQ
jgi:hypothetical protein